jgi:cation-transporting ATPase E
MLARVAQPLNSWRGVLVAVFAAAGVIGMFIPFVARFFDLHLPTGRVLIATVAALLISTALFAVCHVILASVTRIFPHIKPTRQS